MRKNPHGRILNGEPKERHLSVVRKSYSLSNISGILWRDNSNKAI